MGAVRKVKTGNAHAGLHQLLEGGHRAGRRAQSANDARLAVVDGVAVNVQRRQQLQSGAGRLRQALAGQSIEEIFGQVVVGLDAKDCQNKRVQEERGKIRRSGSQIPQQAASGSVREGWPRRTWA